ncbi:MAG: alpha/beta hydrolase [Clostridiales Family XIII bacterium]|jgi:pimeloyl-ACP methyl ester carboxylesterase|nr:alpha/beta hydrolase [Clostridiales Family XIII bacterium]
MAFLTTDDGVKLYYEQFGRGEKTLIFVHGLMDTHASFKEYCGSLGAGYSVVVYDQRAHGASDTPDDGYTNARLAKDLRNLIEHLELRKMVLIGYSLGVHVIFDYIEQFGEAGIDQFILSSMSPRLVNDEEWNLGLATGVGYKEVLAMLGLINGHFKEYCMQGAALYAGPEETRPRMNRFYEEGSGLNPSAMLRLNLGLVTVDYRPTLEKITRPTLVLAGDADIYAVACHEHTRARVKDGYITIIPNGTHFAIMEYPEAYTNAIAEFLEKTG